jgi:hypothetical protein
LYSALITAAVYSFSRPGFVRSADLPISLVWWSFVVALIWLAARRQKNWARWLLLYLFMFETVTALWSSAYLQTRAFYGLFRALITLMEASAYYFAFTGESAAWFARRLPPSATADLFE